KPFSPPCNLHAPGAIPLVAAARACSRGTPSSIPVKSSDAMGRRLSILRHNAEPLSKLAHRSKNRWLYLKFWLVHLS
ncbi:hypothetical protein U9M48_043555, partial [Paspalum notatum var. saurae]